jgi:Do/DeqQ family serine protease
MIHQIDDSLPDRPSLKAARPWRRTVATLLLGAGLATSGTFLAWSPRSPLRQSAQTALVAPSSSSGQADGAAVSGPATANPNFVTDVVNRVGPAVVRIDASRTVSQAVPEAFNDPFFRRFFGNQIPMQPQERVERGLGSGFIISADGQIVTNAHVVDGADTVQVTLKDGRTLEGRVLGADPVTDVAVIKVEGQNLPTVTLSDSEQLQPGEWAIAIGNPLGLDSTVTVGIVSATGRSSSEVGVPDKRVEFIQTDAAINPGNSGGPLLNQQGAVIGMNTAIIQRAQGLGFAIPINTVQRIAEQLAQGKSIEHPFLGIQMVTLTPEVKQQINANPNSGLTVDADRGVLIARVLKGSPAEQAGLRSGDVILQIDQQPVSEASEVQARVESGAVGRSLRMEIRRNRQTQTLNVRPGKFPVQSEATGG